MRNSYHCLYESATGGRLRRTTKQSIISGISVIGRCPRLPTSELAHLEIRQPQNAREFRRRVKNEFDRLGIEMPFPHRTIYIRQDEELTGGVKDTRA